MYDLTIVIYSNRDYYRGDRDYRRRGGRDDYGDHHGDRDDHRG